MFRLILCRSDPIVSVPSHSVSFPIQSIPLRLVPSRSDSFRLVPFPSDLIQIRLLSFRSCPCRFRSDPSRFPPFGSVTSRSDLLLPILLVTLRFLPCHLLCFARCFKLPYLEASLVLAAASLALAANFPSSSSKLPCLDLGRGTLAFVASFPSSSCKLP